MAHRNTLEPAVLDLKFTLANGTVFIDIAKELSKVNRRLYRQGKTYYVGGCSLQYDQSALVPQPDQTTTTFVYIQAAPNSWILHNAWKKAFAAWKRQQKVEGVRGVSGTWSDFKVYLDDAHRTGTTVGLRDSDGNPIASGEWVYSLMLNEEEHDTTGISSIRERSMHLVGANVSTTDWGLVNEYQNSRAQVPGTGDPPVPGSASTSMYAVIAADRSAIAEEIIANQETDNDAPPYDFNDYPGGASNADCTHEVAIGSTAGGLGAMKGFQAPCGLILVKATAAVSLTLHLMPGNYRGVAATPMGQ